MQLAVVMQVNVWPGTTATLAAESSLHQSGAPSSQLVFRPAQPTSATTSIGFRQPSKSGGTGWPCPAQLTLPKYHTPLSPWSPSVTVVALLW